MNSMNTIADITMIEDASCTSCTSGFEALKDFLIFRVDTLDDVSPYHRELADESALEGEASNYADLMAAHETEAGIHGIHYEVRSARTDELLYTTEYADEYAQDPAPESTPTTKTPKRTNNARRTRTTGRTRKEAFCPDKIHQPDQLRMAIA